MRVILFDFFGSLIDLQSLAAGVVLKSLHRVYLFNRD